MIIHIKHKGLRALYETGSTKGINASHAKRLKRMLASMEVAKSPEELNLPGYRLHPLKGNLQGYWSMMVSGNWRIIFRFEGTHVDDVDLTDYH